MSIKKGVPNMILVKVICYVNVENHFLTFIKHIKFARIMLGTPLNNYKYRVIKKKGENEWAITLLNIALEVFASSR